jgi:hypothetical protein
MPRADAGGPWRTGGYACYLLLCFVCCMLWNAGDYARCQSPLIPYYYLWMEQEKRARMERGGGISTSAQVLRTALYTIAR